MGCLFGRRKTETEKYSSEKENSGYTEKPDAWYFTTKYSLEYLSVFRETDDPALRLTYEPRPAEDAKPWRANDESCVSKRAYRQKYLNSVKSDSCTSGSNEDNLQPIEEEQA